MTKQSTINSTAELNRKHKKSIDALNESNAKIYSRDFQVVHCPVFKTYFCANIAHNLLRLYWHWRMTNDFDSGIMLSITELVSSLAIREGMEGYSDLSDLKIKDEHF